MEKHENPLHIVSVQITELGIALVQKAVDGKSNEIPAVQELIKLLDISGCMVVANTLNCQKETAKAVIESGAYYSLNVRDNQPSLKQNIGNFIQDDSLRKSMDKSVKKEKNRERIEKRTAYSSCDIALLEDKSNWENIACISAINIQFTIKSGT